jgi:hypothetical protein
LLGPGRDGATRTEDERGLARWLEAEAEGDKGLGVRLQNGGRGVPRGVRRAWGGGLAAVKAWTRQRQWPIGRLPHKAGEQRDEGGSGHVGCGQR